MNTVSEDDILKMAIAIDNIELMYNCGCRVEEWQCEFCGECATENNNEHPFVHQCDCPSIIAKEILADADFADLDNIQEWTKKYAQLR